MNSHIDSCVQVGCQMILRTNFDGNYVLSTISSSAILNPHKDPV